MTTSKRVTEFHRKFNVPVDIPLNPNDLDLRINLIVEEFREVLQAADYHFSYNEQSRQIEISRPERPNVDPVALLKELADLSYVIAGTAVTFGWNFDEAEQRVHDSNMSKLDENGKPIYREDGKVLKGPNYKAPDLEDLV